MKRREFLWLSAATAVSASRLFAQSSAATIDLQIGGPTAITMPENFTGLSYESAQLAHPEFFSPQNAGLAAMFTRLNKRGVLRLGGNSSEFTKWSEADVSADTTLPAAVNPDTGQREKSTPVITPRAIRNLRGYLDATGWDCIYGLNLGLGTPERDAQEAEFVSETLGTKLIALQIGNEPNLYGKHLRPAGYNFADYIAEWKTFAAAIRKAVPGAKFAGPDVAGQTDWIAEFAKQHSPDTIMLTGHYYAEGPPTDPRMNIDYLLHPTPPLMHDIPLVMQAAREAKLPYRMAEGNSCYFGGKPGVSDVFASALWSGDYMLQVAQAGYSGVNFHGGGRGVYTPIAGDPIAGFTARPVFYGMQLATEFEGATFLETKLEAAGRNITAYAARRGDGLLIAIFNKSDAEVEVRISQHAGKNISSYKELKAPAIDSTQNVSFSSAPPPKFSSDIPLSPYRAVLLQYDVG